MEKKNKTIYAIFKQELKWVAYQIVASFIPLFVACMFQLIVGYKIDLYEIMADYLLAIFAIGMNLKGQELKKRPGMKEVVLDVYRLISNFVAIVSALFYIGLFNEVYISNIITAKLRTRKSIMMAILVTFIVLIIADGAIVVINDCKYAKLENESRETEKNG